MVNPAGPKASDARRGGPQIPRFQSASRDIVSVFAIHFVLAAVAAAGAVFFVSAAWAYAALAIFCSFCLGLLRHSPATFLLFVPLLALRITEFMSGAAIESGAYMTETAAYGHATGAFTRLLLVYLLFFAVATMTTELLWPRLRRLFVDAPVRWEAQARLIWLTLLVIMTIGTIYLIRLGINNGVPLLNGVDRFAYLLKLDSPIYNFIMRNRLVLVPFIGALFAVPAYRWRATALIVWLLAASIAFGEKFTSLVMILSVFAVPAGLVHIARGNLIPLRTVAITATLVIAITVPAVLLAYGATDSLDKAAARYGERIALQGQLWYKVDESGLTSSPTDTQAFASDVATWLRPAEQDATIAGTRFGLYYVMQKYTPTNTLGWTMETGNGFVFSLYPYLLLTLGLVGMLFLSSLLAGFHAWVMALLAESLARPSWLASFAIGRIMASFYSTYSTGFLWNVMGIKSILTLAVGMFLLWEARRRDSWTRDAFERLASRLENNQGRTRR